MNRFEEILKEENLKAKYEMIVIDKHKLFYDVLQFTSLTDFHLFLNSDHYDKIVNRSDNEIRVINIERNEIVFSSKADD